MSTRIALLGDHFVLSRLLREHIEAACPDGDLEFAETTLPWPNQPFARVAEVDEASGSEDETLAALAGAEICVTQMAPITQRVLASARDLKLVCVTRGGPVNVNLAAAAEAGVKVCSAPGRNADATAEHTVSLMLAAARRIPQRHSSILEGQWRSDLYGYSETGPEIAGSTVGLVGYGAVGSRVARIMRGFGAEVLVYDPFAKLDGSDAGIRQSDSLDDVLGKSAIVSVHARLTEQSRGLIGAREVALMPRDSILINAARGGLVDYDAVCDALDSGHLYGAGFDVFDEEPLPADARLLRTPHVVMTPHLAGATKETAQRAAQIAASQVRAYLAGDPVPHLANRVPTVG